jgi:hypothetical protein
VRGDPVGFDAGNLCHPKKAVAAFPVATASRALVLNPGGQIEIKNRMELSRCCSFLAIQQTSIKWSGDAIFSNRADFGVDRRVMASSEGPEFGMSITMARYPGRHSITPDR